MLFYTMLFNHRLTFAIQLDATVMNFDSNAVFSNILNNAAEFGFTNITG